MLTARSATPCLNHDKPASAARPWTAQRARRSHSRPGTSRKRAGLRRLCCLCVSVSGIIYVIGYYTYFLVT